MLEILGNAGHSFTRWPWNCDNVLGRGWAMWGKLDSGMKYKVKLKFLLWNRGFIFEMGGLNLYTSYGEDFIYLYKNEGTILWKIFIKDQWKDKL